MGLLLVKVLWPSDATLLTYILRGSWEKLLLLDKKYPINSYWNLHHIKFKPFDEDTNIRPEKRQNIHMIYNLINDIFWAPAKHLVTLSWSSK